jgi:hypothetical protein
MHTHTRMYVCAPIRSHLEEEDHTPHTHAPDPQPPMQTITSNPEPRTSKGGSGRKSVSSKGRRPVGFIGSLVDVVLLTFSQSVVSMVWVALYAYLFFLGGGGGGQIGGGGRRGLVGWVQVITGGQLSLL